MRDNGPWATMLLDMTVQDIAADPADPATSPTSAVTMALDTSASASGPTIRVALDLPAELAVALKHRTNGRLDIAETCALIVQLYADAPLDRGTMTLDASQHARICAALGFSPQTTETLVKGIEELTKISFGGVKLTLSAEEVGIVHARNASGLSNKEFASLIFRQMFEAWRNGVI